MENQLVSVGCLMWRGLLLTAVVLLTIATATRDVWMGLWALPCCSLGGAMLVRCTLAAHREQMEAAFRLGQDSEKVRNLR